MESITIIVKKPFCAAEVVVVQSHYMVLNQLVEGYFESVPVPFGEDIFAIVNEEGKIKKLPPNVIMPANGDILVGTVLFSSVGMNEDGDSDYASLSDQQILLVQEYLKTHTVPEDYTTLPVQLKNIYEITEHDLVVAQSWERCPKCGAWERSSVPHCFSCILQSASAGMK